MVRLSKKAVQVISDLEFQKKYYFTRDDVRKNFDSDKQLTDFIYNQRKNGRVIKLNRSKYFLVPIKSRSGRWTDHPLIVLDEMMDNSDYYVGGWYAAHFWGFTDQVPMQVDVYTTKKQGKLTVLNKRFVFHRIRPEALRKLVSRKVKGHSFNILKKELSKKWFESRK